MKNDLTCEVVRDLLPSYVDGLTNDVSNQAVEQHIKICENCQKLYHEMQETVNGEYLSEQDLEQMGQKANFKVPSEIDYLKKIRKKNRMRILAAVLTVVIAAGVGIWCKAY
ncbi:MAG: zf-HC2 domain-containing protein, partial [Blautia obeum]